MDINTQNMFCVFFQEASLTPIFIKAQEKPQRLFEASFFLVSVLNFFTLEIKISKCLALKKTKLLYFL